MPTICDIPNEVLFYIFSVGCDELPDDWRWGNNVKRRLHPFIIPVLSVCWGWRTLCSSRRTLDRFFFTYAFLEWETRSDPYKFILQISEYRTTLLSSKNSALSVGLYFLDVPRDQNTLRLHIHAIDMAFRHGKQLHSIDVRVQHPELVKCLAYRLLDASISQSFTWDVALCIDHWESFNISLGGDRKSDVPFGLWNTSRRVGKLIEIHGFSDWPRENIFHQINSLSTARGVGKFDLEKHHSFLLNCQNITSLELGNIQPFASQSEELRQVSLTTVKTLTLDTITSEAVAQIFTSLGLPHLSQVIALNTTPLYPFHSIALPTSVENISCQFFISNVTDVSKLLTHVKNQLFQPGSIVSRTADSSEFSCMMVSTFSSSNCRLPWRLIASAFHGSDILLRALKTFKDTFESDMHGQNGGVCLIELESLIFQMTAELETKKQEAN
jgi:hypothetical protein